MSSHDNSTQQEESDIKELAVRVSRNLVTRGLPGIFLYPMLWPILAVGSGFSESHPTLFWITTIGFIVTSVIRILHSKLMSRAIQKHHTLWTNLFFLVILPHSLGWGLMFALSLNINNELFTLFMSFSSAGIVAGGTNSFAPNKKLAYFFVSTLVLPPLVTSFFIADLPILGAMLIMFYVYLILLSTNQNREYWLSLKNEQKLAKQSRTDALTQLENRRYFDEKLDELCHLSSRNHEQLTVLLVDCDHFKKINDNYGHDVGDKCLKHLANLLKQALPRATDVCARYGGEEFSLLLPGTDLPGAGIVAERIRTLIETTPIDVDGTLLNITVSIGSVSRIINSFEPELPFDLFKQADKALYHAKNNGRNQCCYVYYDANEKAYKRESGDNSPSNVNATKAS